MHEALSPHLGDGVSSRENPSPKLVHEGRDQLEPEASKGDNEGWKGLRVSPGCKGETHPAIKEGTPHTA